MNQIKHIWLNEHEVLSMWDLEGVLCVWLEWSELREGGTVIVRKTLYQGRDEQLANNTYAAKAAEWDV